MKKIVAAFAASMLLFAAVAAEAQEKAYKDGPVVGLSYIKTKGGKFDDYMKFLSTNYKPLMEAYKKAGLILGYNVFSANPRSPSDPDIILSVTYPNMAALDRTDEFDAIDAKVLGSLSTQNKAAADRGEIRQVLGGDLVREMILK
jgi:hypothetical protein